MAGVTRVNHTTPSVRRLLAHHHHHLHHHRKGRKSGGDGGLGSVGACARTAGGTAATKASLASDCLRWWQLQAQAQYGAHRSTHRLWPEDLRWSWQSSLRLEQVLARLCISVD